MSNLAIRVENLGKRYRLGQLGRRDTHKTLRDALASAAAWPFRAARAFIARNGCRRQEDHDILWALKDVSFEVKQGEVLGIIGRNGAGKSTLLKILSRITPPTRGRVEGYGRVGSLLEVGTGFHPELTGRENVYLNGAILGMKRTEIDHKFDEIVAFAEIEKFLDTPVKRYSSGMYVRLAFAVAAHLEPEILLVDEVLAVGDAAFQKKCLGNMSDVARSGRTVLFVSHNLGMVQKLCTRAVLLKDAEVQNDGTVEEVVTTYLKSLDNKSQQDLLARTERRGIGKIQLAHIEISSGRTDRAKALMTGLSAQFAFYVTSVSMGLTCSFTIYDQFGQAVTYFDSALHGQMDTVDSSYGPKFECNIEELPLMPGRYRINAAILCNGDLQDHLEAAAYFEVEPGNFGGRPVPMQTGYGNMFVRHQWVTPN